MKKVVLVIIFIVLLSSPCFAADYYIAQSAAGAGNGTSCENARAITWDQSGVTGDDTVHLCGTLTGQLTIAVSGTSGHPVTFKFETGAKFEDATWTTGTAGARITATGQSYITIDGNNNNPGIRATDNGTPIGYGGTYNNSVDVYGIYLDGCNDVVIKNIYIGPLYDRQTPNNTKYADYFIPCPGHGILQSGTNITVQDSTLSDACVLLFHNIGIGDSAILWQRNTLSNANWLMGAGSVGVTSSLDGLTLDGITGHNGVKWGGCSALPTDNVGNGFDETKDYIYGTDQDSDHTTLHSNDGGEASLMPLTAVSGGTWSRGELTNPDEIRQVVVYLRNDTAGSLNLYEGVMTFTITGTYDGGAQSETITFTLSSANKAMAADRWRAKRGKKPFTTVTNMTLDNVPANGIKISLGTDCSAVPYHNNGLHVFMDSGGQVDNIVMKNCTFGPTNGVDKGNNLMTSYFFEDYVPARTSTYSKVYNSVFIASEAQYAPNNAYIETKGDAWNNTFVSAGGGTACSGCRTFKNNIVNFASGGIMIVEPAGYSSVDYNINTSGAGVGMTHHDIPINSIDGTFTNCETVTGQTSGSTATYIRTVGGTSFQVRAHSAAFSAGGEQINGASGHVHSTGAGVTTAGDNYSYSSYLSETCQNSHPANTLVDPLFVSSSDFRLQSGSPAKWAGTATGQLSAADKLGIAWHSPPSIGAYEWFQTGNINGAVISGAVVK